MVASKPKHANSDLSSSAYAQANQPMPPTYTALFCEENIWQLCKHWHFRQGEAQVVFISNPAEQCPMWQMKAGDLAGPPVIWDYHVILITQTPLLVWDFDSRLAFPSPLNTYLSASFHPRLALPYQPHFKVVDAAYFLNHFCSDRQHMRDAAGQWLATPPAWPLIGAGKSSNLAAYRDMTQPDDAAVFNFETFCRHYQLQSEAVRAASDLK